MFVTATAPAAAVSAIVTIVTKYYSLLPLFPSSLAFLRLPTGIIFLFHCGTSSKAAAVASAL